MYYSLIIIIIEHLIIVIINDIIIIITTVEDVLSVFPGADSGTSENGASTVFS